MKHAKAIATAIILVSLLYIMKLHLEELRLDSYSLGVSDGVEAGFEQGFKAGVERGQKSGRNDLAHELIMACIAESADPPSCTMEYEVVKNRPTTITIGGKQLFCRQGDSPIAC